MSFTRAAPPGWHLRPLGQSGLPRSYEIVAGGLTLGRDPSNRCVLDGDAHRSVSSHHARIDLKDGKAFAEDLGSRNGTFINGEGIEREELKSGDILQLGAEGPRFAVTNSAGLEQTSLIDKNLALADRPKALGQTAFVSLKKALGIPEQGGIDAMVRKRSRRHLVFVAAGLATLAIAGVVSLDRVEHRNEARSATMERRNVELAQRNAALDGQLTEALTRVDEKLESQARAWTYERARLSRESAELTRQITELENRGSASSDEVELLRQRLSETTAHLERYNPLELEHEKLAQVSRVRNAVVLIETRLTFRERLSHQLLYLASDGHGEPTANLERRGEPLARLSTGSGFCISEHGSILTNAHVVSPPDFGQSLELAGGSAFDTEVEIAVVFSGDSKRHAARIVGIDNQDDDDIALIAITPFEGMPHLPPLTFAEPPPPPGTEVYLYGFPLGTYAMQEGDKVIASTLKGILSRRVGSFLQIDAGVHPGISGGPLTDASGRVLGIVCSVQQTPQGEIAPSIGYVLPIATAQRVLAIQKR